jgi:hypothetical protein
MTAGPEKTGLSAKGGIQSSLKNSLIMSPGPEQSRPDAVVPTGLPDSQHSALDPDHPAAISNHRQHAGSVVAGFGHFVIRPGHPGPPSRETAESAPSRARGPFQPGSPQECRRRRPVEMANFTGSWCRVAQSHLHSALARQSLRVSRVKRGTVAAPTPIPPTALSSSDPKM